MFQIFPNCLCLEMISPEFLLPCLIVRCANIVIYSKHNNAECSTYNSLAILFHTHTLSNMKYEFEN